MNDVGTADAEGERELRFAFGENWNRYLDDLGDEQIEHATRALATMLGGPLAGARFLDVGCGSGLSSLAAVRLGAEVVAFDVDPDSVAASERLRDRAGVDPARWSIRRGSALDGDLFADLGRFDVVYSWGVLHHTGAMWRAIDQVGGAVEPGGRLWLALYNDQGWRSDSWRRLKRRYNESGPAMQRALVLAAMVPTEARHVARSVATGHNPLPRYRTSDARGMVVYRDWVDWVGGYPFEVSRPEELLAWGNREGFRLLRMKTCGGGLGCNEFLFQRDDADLPALAGEVPA